MVGINTRDTPTHSIGSRRIDGSVPGFSVSANARGRRMRG